jgi:hypothetical protein
VSLDASQSLVQSLTVALEASQSRVETLQLDVAARDMEIDALKAERRQDARSRSPRRDAMSAAKTHRVLNLVQHFERDAVIDEQRETIARQQQEIVSLRRGDGPIGEVLMHNWRQTPGAMTDFTVNTLKAQTTPVNTTMASLQRLANAASDISFWGGMSPSQATTLSPVVRTYPSA